MGERARESQGVNPFNTHILAHTHTDCFPLSLSYAHTHAQTHTHTQTYTHYLQGPNHRRHLDHFRTRSHEEHSALLLLLLLRAAWEIVGMSSAMTGAFSCRSVRRRWWKRRRRGRRGGGRWWWWSRRGRSMVGGIGRCRETFTRVTIVWIGARGQGSREAHEGLEVALARCDGYIIVAVGAAERLEAPAHHPEMCVCVRERDQISHAHARTHRSRAHAHAAHAHTRARERVRARARTHTQTHLQKSNCLGTR